MSSRRPPREPVGWDVFGDPVYSQRQAGPPPLPSYTSATLPAYLRTPKQSCVAWSRVSVMSTHTT